MSDSTVFNGVNGATGEYLSSISIEEVARIVVGEPAETDDVLKTKAYAAEAAFGLPFGVDPMDLAQSGWGIIAAHDVSPDTLDALKVLLDLRRQQAGERYKEFTAAQAYRPEEKARKWLQRQGASDGPAQVKKVPYYLLIVGDPAAIPFRFQYELGVNYAVGRLAFDTAQEYRNYAESVVASEKAAAAPTPRRALFFGVRNDGDQATQMSSKLLIEPLVAALGPVAGTRWQVQTVLASEATKAALGARINAAEPPNLLFTASHGMGFPAGHELQRSDQGALLCQDWPGPLAYRQPIPRDFYFSGSDVSDAANLSRSIAFHFACYGAGTPQLDEYAHAGGVRGEIAPASFLARLPQRLLGKPDGAALAVVGHVERAWSYSFASAQLDSQTSTFESCFSALMAGARVGAAMDAFAMRHAALAVGLNGELEDIKFGAQPDERSIAAMWTANNDARNYLVIGDPAVRIPD